MVIINYNITNNNMRYTMNIYEFAENKTLDKLNEDFTHKFKKAYKKLNCTGKNSLLKYLPTMYKKWYYSTYIEDTVLTPELISEFSYKEKGIYSVIRINSVKKLSEPEFITLKYSIDNHPICNDFKALLDLFESGVVVDENMEISFEDIKRINSVINCDPHYISYLIMLAIDTGCIEKMSSVGVDKYCTTPKTYMYTKITNKLLLEALFDSALNIASDFLNSTYPITQKEVSKDKIYSWLKKDRQVDDIFKEAYTDIPLDMDLVIDNMDEFEIALTADMYTKGILIDKWFLTPFSSYFRFIDTFYFYEYSINEEIQYILRSIKAWEETGEIDIIDAGIYSPCTSYKISKIGADFFKLKYEENIPPVFSSLNTNEILKGILDPESSERQKVESLSLPSFYVHTLKVFIDGKEFFNIQIPESCSLDNIHKFIINIFKETAPICKSYRFYKLPESPFTEYAPAFIKKRGPHTHDHTITDVIDKGEICYYEVIFLDETNDSKALFEIQLDSTDINNINVKYPVINF